MKLNVMGWIIGAVMAGAMSAGAASLWMDDFEAAKAAAKKQNKFMLLNFTGSDWCGWCIRLSDEVFSKNTFKKYAAENLICVELDFPRRKSINEKTERQNYALQDIYGVLGYPTIILLDPKGEEVGRTGYRPGGAEKYVEYLKELLSPNAAEAAAPVVVSVPETAPSVQAPVDSKEIRTWTSTSGHTVAARYDKQVGNLIELHRADGSAVRIDLSALSEGDHHYLCTLKVIP